MGLSSAFVTGDTSATFILLRCVWMRKFTEGNDFEESFQSLGNRNSLFDKKIKTKDFIKGN